MQCAAVNTMVSEIKAAPQYCPEPVLEGRNKAANHGHAFFFEICPFTIRVWKFLIPQPEMKDLNRFKKMEEVEIRKHFCSQINYVYY